MSRGQAAGEAKLVNQETSSVGAIVYGSYIIIIVWYFILFKM